VYRICTLGVVQCIFIHKGKGQGNMLNCMHIGYEPL